MSGFSLDWLRLRAPFDLAARNAALAARFAAALRREPGRPVHIADLGAGTGSNARILAPVIGGDQVWHLFDSDPTLVGWQVPEHLAWASRQGHRARKEGEGVVLVETAEARWRFESVGLDLAVGIETALATPRDAIVMTAFADLVGAAWVDTLGVLLARRRLPLLSVLMVDGRRQWLPEVPGDAILRTAFATHQRRDKGFGPALGPDAPRYLAAVLAARGFAVATAASDWHIGRSDQPMLTALIAAEAGAASEAAPEAADAIERWWRQRRAQLAAGQLRAIVGHRDVLALPR
jgi:hypothetical protein